MITAQLIERVDHDVRSLHHFQMLRRRFAAFRPAPKVMHTRASGVDISSPGRQSLTLLIGEETAGSMYVGDVVLAQGFGAPPHHQPTEEEMWYLLDGQMDVRVGLQSATIHAGGE